MSFASATARQSGDAETPTLKPAERAKALTTAALDTLATQLDHGGSDALRAYLDVARRFHRYSYRNQLLIHTQRPDATHVAGFHAWRTQFGRCVAKGEKGIAILAPMVGIDKKAVVAEGAEPSSRVFGFRVVYVFDVAQTTGEELPTITIQPDGDDTAGIGDRLTAWAREQGLTVVAVSRETLDGADGRTNGRRIELGDWLTGAARACTLAHELAHTLLHSKESPISLKLGEVLSRDMKELEAESVAYVISHAAGFGRLDALADYAINWEGSRERLESSLHRIHAATHVLMPAAGLVL